MEGQRDIFGQKKRLLSTLVLSIAIYGAECWIFEEADKKLIESFELWCFPRVLRRSWTSKTSDEDVLAKYQPETRQLTTILQRKTALRMTCDQRRRQVGQEPTVRYWLWSTRKRRTKNTAQWKGVLRCVIVWSRRVGWQRNEMMGRDLWGEPRWIGFDQTVNDDNDDDDVSDESFPFLLLLWF